MEYGVHTRDERVVRGYLRTNIYLVLVGDVLKVQTAVVQHHEIAHRVGIEGSSVFEPRDKLNRGIALNVTPNHSRQMQWHVLEVRCEVHSGRVFYVEVRCCCVRMTDTCKGGPKI